MSIDTAQARSAHAKGEKHNYNRSRPSRLSRAFCSRVDFNQVRADAKTAISIGQYRNADVLHLAASMARELPTSTKPEVWNVGSSAQ
jgi:hypothetical protein